MAVVGDAGVVTFTSVQVGEAADFIVSVQDTADVSETILGATATGPGATAFTVTSTLPIAVPGSAPSPERMIRMFFPPKSPVRVTESESVSSRFGARTSLKERWS